MKSHKRAYPSINGGMIHEDKAVKCRECNRTMAKWELVDHCCEYAQLIELPTSSTRTHPIMFAGVVVGILKEQGSKLSYYLPGNVTPHVVIENPAYPHMWGKAV